MEKSYASLLREVESLQVKLTELWHVAPVEVPGDCAGLLELVAENHQRNFQLWHEEDIARRDDLPLDRIKQAKRAIDRFNQERNNFIERMDEFLVRTVQPSPAGPNCPQNSETPGMIIDRLSILALKEYHMREETVREDVDDAHRGKCNEKLARIVLQRMDLVRCLTELMADVVAQCRTFAVYYQFKMYNDPALNPQLYQKAKSN